MTKKMSPIRITALQKWVMMDCTALYTMIIKCFYLMVQRTLF